MSLETQNAWIDSQFIPPKCGCVIQDNKVTSQCATHRHARVMKMYILHLNADVGSSLDGTIKFGKGPYSHQQALTDLCTQLLTNPSPTLRPFHLRR